MFNYYKEQEKPKNLIVRVSTEAYQRGDTYFLGKSIRVLKRRSEGVYDYLREDIQCNGVEYSLSCINLLYKEDGLYEVTCDYDEDPCGMGDEVFLNLTPLKE